MKIHEYQGKEILRKFHVPVPNGMPAFTAEEAVKVAKEIGSANWVIKAQIHAGGRGKGGGVKIANSINQVYEYANQILGMNLITQQTGSEGKKVRRLLVEEGVKIQKEFYLAIVIDRAKQKVVVVASGTGGVEIEEIAAREPKLVHKIAIDPMQGIADIQMDVLFKQIGVPNDLIEKAKIILIGLYQAFWDMDASLSEINPLALTADGSILALDVKFDFDSNALFRHPEILEYRDFEEEDRSEIDASKFDLSYISLNGNIGCLVNGAGLAMATMDTIKLFGGEPANFLDVGGGATAEKVREAFNIMLRAPHLKAILVNIFGGIMRCDVIAEGIIEASKAVFLQMPLVVRMKGTNEDLGKKMLKASGLSIISAESMEEAAQYAVTAAKENRSKIYSSR